MFLQICINYFAISSLGKKVEQLFSQFVGLRSIKNLQELSSPSHEFEQIHTTSYKIIYNLYRAMSTRGEI
jgi:hypothetical protein